MVDRLIDAIGRGVAWLNLAMAAAMCLVVALRYAFDIGAIFLQESIVYMHGAAFLAGISYTLKPDADVRVDILYSRFSPQTRTCIDLAGHVLLTIPLAVAIVVLSFGYAVDSWRVLEGSAEVSGVPAVFLLKTLIPVSAALLFAQAAVLSWRALGALRRRD